MNEPQHIKRKMQLIWGVALTLVSIGVFVRIPQVIPKLAQTPIGQSATTIGFVRICLYFMGIILLGGGIKKIINYFHTATTEPGNVTTDSDLNGSGR